MVNKLKGKDIWVVIAAFNEGRVIKNVIESLMEMVDHVLVVNDCSSDVTTDISLLAGARVLEHIENLGQGAAIQTGIDYALTMGAKYIVTFDGDGQHDPSDLVNMYEKSIADKLKIFYIAVIIFL